MNLEGKPCGVCGKGRLKGFKDEVADGIHVDAYQCEHGHVSYSREVMEKVEAMRRATSQERHIVKVGSSIAVPIPASIAKLLELKPREKVFVALRGNSIVIRPSLS